MGFDEMPDEKGRDKSHVFIDSDSCFRRVREAARSCKGEAELRERPGHDRVCHIGGRFGGDSHRGHRSVSPQAPRALDGHRRRNKLPVSVRFGLRDEGQATVEYAVVLFGMLAVVAGLSVLARFFESGSLVDHALMSASHHVSGVSTGSIVDVFLY